MMDYKIRYKNEDLDSTCFIEIGPGKYNHSHWQDGFAFFRDDAFAVAEGIVAKHFPAYDHLGMNDVPKAVVILMIADLRAIAERLPKLERRSIQIEMNLEAAFFGHLEEEIDSNRFVIADFLRALANDCERFTQQSDWLCILGM